MNTSPASSTSGGSRCPYCGGWLDLRHDFCIRCAFPYREPDPRIWGDLPPLQASLETRVASEGRSSLNFFCILAVGLVLVGGLREMAGDQGLGTVLFLQELFIASVTTGYLASRWNEVSHLFSKVRSRGLVLASFPLLAVLLLVNHGYHSLLLPFAGDGEDEVQKLFRVGGWPVLILVICVLPAVFEEIGFRGVVQERLVSSVGRTAGWLLTSVLFVALHFSFLSGPYLLLFSLFLCWIRHETASIYPPMALHFLHNLCVVIFSVRVQP